MNRKIFAGSLISVATLALSGCFESSNFNPNAPLPGTPGSPQEIEGFRTGQVMNSYLVGAIVCVDLNYNGQCGGSEPQSTSIAQGQFTINTDNLTAPTLAIQGNNRLTAPAGSKVISPISTIINSQFQSQLAAGKSSNLAHRDAVQAVKDSLGIQSVDLLNTDYVAAGQSMSAPRKIGHISSVLNQIFQTNRSLVETAAVNANLNQPKLPAALDDLVWVEVGKKVKPVADTVNQLVDSGQPVNTSTLATSNDIDPTVITNDIENKVQAKIEVLDKVAQSLNRLNPGDTTDVATGGTGGTGGTGTN